MASYDRIIDLRSDTVTIPCSKMRQAIAEAEVGDDVYEEDPTVNKLQKEAASLLGKEAALFVPSGTMGNLISVMSHCFSRGQEVLLGDKSHLFLSEQGGLAQIGGVNPYSVTNRPDGTLDLQELKRKIRMDDPHFPVSRLICIENSHSFSGGKAISPDYIEELSEIAKENNLFLHCDGARLMNAAVALGVKPAELVRHCDSVSMCFSKGLGAPVGSIVAGSEDFIYRANRVRKVLGGAMRQAGILASAALYSLENNVERIKEDHLHAHLLAKAFKDSNCPHFQCISPETNILIINSKINAVDFCERMNTVTDKEKSDLGLSIRVLMSDIYEDVMRMVTHLCVSREEIDLAIKKLHYVINEFN